MRKGRRGMNLLRDFMEGRFYFCVLGGDCGVRSGDHFVPGRITAEDLKLPSFLAAQRKAFNFPYFHLGDCNLHLQENEGVIFLVSRHLG